MENPPFLMGKSTNYMAMFNSKLLVYQRISWAICQPIQGHNQQWKKHLMNVDIHDIWGKPPGEGGRYYTKYLRLATCWRFKSVCYSPCYLRRPKLSQFVLCVSLWFNPPTNCWGYCFKVGWGMIFCRKVPVSCQSDKPAHGRGMTEWHGSRTFRK